MAFMKDPDAHTRGVGAIAAVDRNVRRRAQSQRRAAATRVHDRAKVAIVGTGASRLPGVIPGTVARPMRGAMGGFGLNLFGPRNTGPVLPPPAKPLKTYQAINSTIGPGTIIIDPGPSGSNPNTQGSVASSSSTPDPTQPIIAIQPAPQTTGAPATVAVAPAPADNTNTYLLLGGAAVAAYLLFFRKGG